MTQRKQQRRSLRRAVAIECSVACDVWDGSIALRASDVSHDGLWIDTPFPLELGEELVLAFAPPGGRQNEEVWAIAEVARVGLWRRNESPCPAGMGLAFTYLNSVDRRFLERSLIGHPPRLPGRRRPPPLPSARAREPAQLSLSDVTFLVPEDHAFDIVALSDLLTSSALS